MAGPGGCRRTGRQSPAVRRRPGASPIGALLSAEVNSSRSERKHKAPSGSRGCRIESMELAYASGRRLSLATRAHRHWHLTPGSRRGLYAIARYASCHVKRSTWHLWGRACLPDLGMSPQGLNELAARATFAGQEGGLAPLLLPAAI